MSSPKNKEDTIYTINNKIKNLELKLESLYNVKFQKEMKIIPSLHKLGTNEFIKQILKMINWKRRGVHESTQMFHYYIKSYLSNYIVGTNEWFNNVLAFHNEIIILKKRRIPIANPELFSIEISFP